MGARALRRPELGEREPGVADKPAPSRGNAASYWLPRTNYMRIVLYIIVWGLFFCV